MSERKGSVATFIAKKPCSDCPYRMDAPIKKWAANEFANLYVQTKAKENGDPMGSKMFGCHKKNGSVCVGWAIKQDERRTPSNHFRLWLLVNQKHEELFAIDNPHQLYDSVEEMIAVNYPELIDDLENHCKS